MRGERYDDALDMIQDILPVGADLFGMETEHGIAVARVLATDVEDGGAGFEVDARHEDMADTCLTGTGHHLVAVGGELLTIEVTMGIYESKI